MKKLFLILFFLTLSISNAQNDKGDFTVSPQFGLNLSNYRSSENLSNKIRPSFNAGFITEYYFGERWSLRSGLRYDSKGTIVKEFGQKYIDKLSYLAIPLHANLHFGDKNNWFLNFGPTLGFILSAKADTPDGESNIEGELKNTFDLGLEVGFGYKFLVTDNTYMFFQYS